MPLYIWSSVGSSYPQVYPRFHLFFFRFTPIFLSYTAYICMTYSQSLPSYLTESKFLFTSFSYMLLISTPVVVFTIGLYYKYRVVTIVSDWDCIHNRTFIISILVPVCTIQLLLLGLVAYKDDLANLEDLTAMGLQGSSDLIIGEWKFPKIRAIHVCWDKFSRFVLICSDLPQICSERPYLPTATY